MFDNFADFFKVLAFYFFDFPCFIFNLFLYLNCVSGICAWSPALLTAGALKRTEGGGSTTRQIEGQRQVDVKLGTIFPPHALSLLDLFTHECSIKAEGLVA